MTWIIRILLILVLLALVGRALWRFVEGIIAGASPPGAVPDRGAKMVRDPVCGTYVVASRALSATSGRGTAYFCSEECRRRWQAS